jgi:hypothetical protein
MKKLFIALSLCLLAVNAMSQAVKKPTLMVVPADVWCTHNGYMEQYDNQGTYELIPNYKIALQTNSDLMNVITKIGELMTERGFPLVDLSQTLRSISTIDAENSLLSSRSSGAVLAENPVDRLRNRAKSDIILEVDWQINSTGPKKSITYNLRGLDAYTNKQVAAAQGTGAPSFSAEIPVLLAEAVTANMDNFTSQLQSHFDDIFENGREVTLDVLVFDNGSGVTLEDEYDGYELIEIIENWVAENTVQNRFSLSDASEVRMLFEQVRMPLFRENNMAMDTRTFARQLSRFLSRAPYNLDSKVLTKGLGRAQVVIGEK